MLTAVTHETIDCRSIFETHYTTLTTSPPPPTIEESSYSRITMYSRSYHRSSHLQRSTGSAWFIARIELIPNLVRFFSIPFFFVSRRRRGVEKRNREERTTRAARSMAKADGTRMELVSFGSRTERIGLSIRNALARCPDQGAPRPRFSFLRLFLPRLFAQDRPSSWDKKNTIETRWNF